MTDRRPTSSSYPVMFAESGQSQLVNFKFVLAAPWTACRICGALCQTELDRLAYRLMMENPSNSERYLATYEESKRLRDEWRLDHERKNHTEAEIRYLEVNNIAVTPQAAMTLASYGIITFGTIDDPVLTEETDQALFEAPRIPINDAVEF